MAEEIALVLGMLAAVYGVAELVLRLGFYLLFGKKQGHICWIVSAPGNNDNMEYAARQLSAVRRFVPGCCKAVMLAGDEDAAWVRKLCEELNVHCYTGKEFTEMLSDGLQEDKKAV